jgi:signal transduction histidine kinase
VTRLPRASHDPASRSAIEKAKLEWEGTADALAELVCLLDRKGRVLRVNRVLEDWSLGTVRSAPGSRVHGVLHPACGNTECALRHFVDRALRNIVGGRRTRNELQQELGARQVHFSIRPLRVSRRASDRLHGPLAVFAATDVTALHRAQRALGRANLGLEERVRARTMALADANRDLLNEVIRREQAEVALRASRNELVALSEQLIGAQEGERKRIALELHDSVGQSLTAVKYTLERGLELLRNPQLGDVSEVLRLAVERIQQTAENIRSISMNLRPRILDDLGAASAVHWFCRDFADTYPALNVHTDLGVGDREIPERLATVVYRCVQELLNNAAKHARARNVWVKLGLTDGVLMLSVRDDGVGMDKSTPQSHRNGSGLRNLRERAQMTGGDFSILTSARRGAFAQVIWQLGEQERVAAALAPAPAQSSPSHAS